jgi:hypothetical protein
MNGPAPAHRPVELPLLADPIWQMTYGERAAFQGVLEELRPALAIEIGTAEGASLRRIAALSGEVHSFDLVEPQLDLPEHVTLHTGDSHALLPEVLAALAAEGRNVDFVLVDGDHSAEGAQQDLEDLLDSDAIRETVIIAHDTANERVRAGLDAVDYDAYEKVRAVELDMVPGHLGAEKFPGELWGGLGLVVVSASDPRPAGTPAVSAAYAHHTRALEAARDADALADEHAALRDGAAGGALRVAELEAEIARLALRKAEAEGDAARHAQLVRDLVRSPSWRITAPLRALKRAAARRR